jgi:malate/lactate dehydrogenase
MKIAIWGAGTLGYGLAFRLMTSDFTTELAWINRSYDKIQSLGIDFRHGLAFAPNCREVHCYREKHAEYAIEDSDILILCHGIGVRNGQTRKDVYKANTAIFKETIITMLIL